MCVYHPQEMIGFPWYNSENEHWKPNMIWHALGSQAASGTVQIARGG